MGATSGWYAGKFDVVGVLGFMHMPWAVDSVNDVGVVDAAIVNGNLYGAWRDAQGFVTAFVAKLTYSRAAQDLCYREMGEMMGPYYYDIPERIFKLLSPLPQDRQWDSAREWRKQVVAQRNAKKAANALVKSVKPGNTIRTSFKYQLYGTSFDRWVAVNPKTNRFHPVGIPQLAVKLRAWKKYIVEVVG